MAYRKNKRRIDPRYFLHETANRDALVIIEAAGGIPILNKRLIRRAKWDALEAVSAPLTRLVKGMLRTKETKEQVVTAMKAVQLSKQGGRPRNPLSPPTPHHRLQNERPTAATGPWSGTDPTWEQHQRVWDRKEEKYLQDVKTWRKDKEAYDDHRKGIKAPVLTADDLDKLVTDVTRGGADGTGLEWQELRAAIDKIRKVEVKGEDGRTRVEYEEARRIINETLDAHAQLGTTPSQPLGDSKAARVVNPVLLTFLLGISGSLQGAGWATNLKPIIGYGIVITMIALAAHNLTGEAQKTANRVWQWIQGALGFDQDIEYVVEEFCGFGRAKKRWALNPKAKGADRSRTTINTVTGNPKHSFCVLPREYDFVARTGGEFQLDHQTIMYTLACPQAWAEILDIDIEKAYAERQVKGEPKQLNPKLINRVQEIINRNIAPPSDAEPGWVPELQLVKTTKAFCSFASPEIRAVALKQSAAAHRKRSTGKGVSCGGLKNNPRDCFTGGAGKAFCDHCPDDAEGIQRKCYELDAKELGLGNIVLASTWEDHEGKAITDVTKRASRCLTPKEFKDAEKAMKAKAAKAAAAAKKAKEALKDPMGSPLQEGCAQGPRVKKMKLKLRSTQ
jgi:hypothetical protein|tara:strand:- start:3380 stop:5236 length:1857 start_codon:yes stop_codon:yes gene_type:complete